MSVRPKRGDARRRSDGNLSLSASRCLRILCAFAPEREEIGVTDLSREFGVSKSIVHRLVRALEMHGFLDQDPQTRKYRIGLTAFQVGSLFLNSRALEREALPHMRRLVDRSGHTCQLGVLHDGEVILTASIDSPRPVRVSSRVGDRRHPHVSAIGKVLLDALSDEEVDAVLGRRGMPRMTPKSITSPRQLKAELRLVRLRGYALNWEENRPGTGSIAAPIRDPEGTVIAAVAIGFPTHLVARRDVPVLAAQVRETAEAISKEVWGHGARTAGRRPAGAKGPHAVGRQ